MLAQQKVLNLNIEIIRKNTPNCSAIQDEFDAQIGSSSSSLLRHKVWVMELVVSGGVFLFGGMEDG